MRDVAEAVAFYRETLEFTLVSGGDDKSHSSLTRGDAHVMIDGRGFLRRRVQRCDQGTTGETFVHRPVHRSFRSTAFYSRLEAADARIVDPLATRPWGQEQFTVEDHEGNWLTFWNKSVTD